MFIFVSVSIDKTHILSVGKRNSMWPSLSHWNTMLDYPSTLLRAVARTALTSKNVRVEKKIQRKSDSLLNIYFQISILLLFAESIVSRSVKKSLCDSLFVSFTLSCVLS